MKISINTDPAAEEVVFSITCPQLTPEIEKLISMIRMMNMQITGIKDGEVHLLDTADILYIDTADKKTFIYTKDSVYETNLHLYELEEQLIQSGFFRANKSSIINFKYISTLRTDIDRKIRVTLENGEQLIISRQYSDYIKRKLGVKGEKKI